MRPAHALPENAGCVTLTQPTDNHHLRAVRAGAIVLLRERTSVRYARLLSGPVVGVCRPHCAAERHVTVADGAGDRTYRLHSVGRVFFYGDGARPGPIEGPIALTVTEAPRPARRAR